MTLEQLSQQYYDAASELESLIAINRKRLASASKRFDTDEEYRLRSKLQSLYTQHRELLDIAAHLKHYYKFSKGA